MHADRKVMWRTPREVLDALHGMQQVVQQGADFGEGGSHRYEAVGPEVPCTTSIVARHLLRVTMRPCGHCPMVTRHGHDEFRTSRCHTVSMRQCDSGSNVRPGLYKPINMIGGLWQRTCLNCLTV